MCFTSWSDFTEEFVLTFFPENEAAMALMQLESNGYFQGKWNVEAYIDEFKDLIDLSGYIDPIAIMLKFHQGLNLMTQDRIANAGMDRPSDMDFNSWFKAARRLGLNRLVNEAFHLASRCPPTHSAPTPTTYPIGQKAMGYCHESDILFLFHFHLTTCHNSYAHGHPIDSSQQRYIIV
jgi:hypothetical protein